jgi:hypothetical protein
MFVNTKTPTCFGPFYSTILRGLYAVLCAVTVMSSFDLRTQISGRHYSNSTKHGMSPPGDGRI